MQNAGKQTTDKLHALLHLDMRKSSNSQFRWPTFCSSIISPSYPIIARITCTRRRPRERILVKQIWYIACYHIDPIISTYLYANKVWLFVCPCLFGLLSACLLLHGKSIYLSSIIYVGQLIKLPKCKILCWE